MNTPAQQLLEKLILQQESLNYISPSPLLLFEYSTHVGLRAKAAAGASSTPTTTTRPSSSRVQQQQQQQQANAQAEADLYRRAQLRTPAEDAQRSVWGGPLWLDYLSQELLRITSARKNNDGRPDLVWLSTTTRSVPYWLLEHSENNQVLIVDVSSFYHGIFEDNDDENQSKVHPLVTLLDQIQSTLQKKEESSSCTPIVLESLTPLVQLYGFSATQQFLQALQQMRSSLLMVPVVTESFTTLQHQSMEDMAHSILWLSHHTGQVDLHVLRRGIREQDSTVREMWEFRIQRQPQQQQHPFRLVVGTKDDSKSEAETEEAPDHLNLLEAMNPALNPEAKPAAAPPPPPLDVEDAGATAKGTTTKRTKKIALKLEDDNVASVAATPKPTPATATTATPRIFIQDDDPEFEDFDEEDPDDDLDI